MTSRECVRQTITFTNSSGRLPMGLPEEYGNDFAGVGMSPSTDRRPNGACETDEWGAVWENIGVSGLGEVKVFPLPDWSQWDDLNIPDISIESRWENLDGARERAGDKFLMASGVSLYERAHFVRGLQNLWMDIYEHPDELCKLLDVLVDMNLYAIDRYATVDADGYMWCDDWGLQHGLMIKPDSWREFWKPRYARVYQAAHDAGMLTFLHSCGDITGIMDDLIDAGLDVIQMDQQQNMGVERLGREWGGRITFWCPVDIQNIMVNGSLDDIRAYCHTLVDTLGRPNGGFIAKWYGDPAGAGHRQEAIDAMCEEFVAISNARVAARTRA